MFYQEDSVVTIKMDTNLFQEFIQLEYMVVQKLNYHVCIWIPLEISHKLKYTERIFDFENVEDLIWGSQEKDSNFMGKFLMSHNLEKDEWGGFEFELDKDDTTYVIIETFGFWSFWLYHTQS